MTDHPAAIGMRDRFRDLDGQVLPVGNCSKLGMSGNNDPAVTKLSAAECRGIVSYDASEFLITALAGTPIQEVVSVLGDKGQYLPFDPPFLDRNPTIGGTVAAGISGSQRLLYGGLRDFVMEVQFVDGHGELVRGGGKVVKNAAGFDLPKLMCGSFGRLGILTEVTLKVLPKPTGQLLLEFVGELEECLSAIQKLSMLCVPISGMDLLPGDDSDEFRLVVTCLAPLGSLDSISETTSATTSLSWRRIDENPDEVLRAVPDDAWLFRIASDIEILPQLQDLLAEYPNVHPILVSGRCGSVWAQGSSPEAFELLDQPLSRLGASAVSVLGNVEKPVFAGDRSWVKFANRVKQAIDPQGRFLDY